MTTTTTWETLIEEIAERLFATEDTIKVTATGGSTTTFVASSKVYSSASSNAYDGVGVFILDTTDDAAPKGEFTRVTAGGFAGGTGTWTVSPAFSTAVASGDTGLFLYGVTPEEMLDAANRIVTTLYLPRYLPLTLVPDGDMEAPTDSAYSAVGGGSISRVSAGAGNVILRQSEAVVGTSDGDGVQSAAMNVFAGETLYVSVAIRCDTGAAEVELYDADAGAVISGTSYTTNEEGFAEIRFTYAVGSGVERVRVQVTQDGSTALNAYIGWISVLSDSRVVHDLPSAVAEAKDVLDFWTLPEGNVIDEDAQMLWAWNLRPFPQVRSWVDYSAITSHRVELPRLCYESPLFVRFRAAGTPMTGLTSTTYAPKDAVVYGTVAELMERMARKLPLQLQRSRLAEAQRLRNSYEKSLPEDVKRPVARFRTPARVAVPPAV